MSEDTRASMIGALWFFSTIALVALFISAGIQGELTLWHVLLACVILALTVVATPLLFRWTAIQVEEGKSKRRTLNMMLNDLNDDELLELKQRLDTADTFDYVGDDGELVLRD